MSESENLDPAEQRRVVRERYATVAAGEEDDAGGSDGGSSTALGYEPADLATVADGADLGLGCGNPTGIADLHPGEAVLDFGTGAGLGCFLAAEQVGDDGRVIGIDTTSAMVEKARDNAGASDVGTVEFRLGEIEHLPVADASVEVGISNCVINLSPDKPGVVREAARVLRPGGRLAASDVVLTAEPPTGLELDPESVDGCIAGAASVPDLESMLSAAGFVDVAIVPKDDSASFISEWDRDVDPNEFVRAARIEGRRPG